MIELVNYIKENGLEKLLSEFKIKATYSEKHPQLVCLKYNQVESPLKEKVAQQCRGIILDTADDWKIVSRSYDKFFNYGEGDGTTCYHDRLDWNSARVYEKLDGSLLTLYPYKGEWLVQSSSNPDASGMVNGSGISFAELFWEVWREKGYKLPKQGPVDYCYMFELITKRNKIVVPYAENRLILHGVRCLTSGHELFVDDEIVDSFMLGYERVERLWMYGWDSVLISSKNLPVNEGEGYVVCDRQFNRIKVKSPTYCAMHHLKGTMSPTRLLQVVMLNENLEFLAYFPEMAAEIEGLRSKYSYLVDRIEKTWLDIKDIENQKDFAMKAKDLEFSAILFQLRKTPTESVTSVLSKQRVELVQKMLPEG